MDFNFILLILSALSLPLLSICAILLRRNIFKGVWKFIFLIIGLLLLVYSIFATINEHKDNLSFSSFVIGIVTAFITIFILSKFNHQHKHNPQTYGAKGIVISEAFHSLLDGAVIGGTYLINPLLGYSATLGIIIHEFPKIIGTLTLLRSLGLSVQKTFWYGVLSQIGSPSSAILIYILGTQIEANQLQTLEIASISSLGAIVFWIIYLEIRYHKNEHKHEK